MFELQIPQAFSDWRDATMNLIANVLGSRDPQPRKPQVKYALDRHHGLIDKLSAQYHGRRIVLLFSVKPHTGTHRKYKKAIPNIRDDDVCLPNALQYEYYDQTLDTYTGVCVPTEDVAQRCMYRIPGTEFKALERFLYRPPTAPDGLPPNEVIASLSECPPQFSMDEYKAFAMLPLGRNIIYSNILAQLAAPTVDFSKTETQICMLQIIGQAGVSDGTSDPGRVSHRILQEASFSHAMLEQLERLYCVSVRTGSHGEL